LPDYFDLAAKPDNHTTVFAKGKFSILKKLEMKNSQIYCRKVYIFHIFLIPLLFKIEEFSFANSMIV
jgi:hypothetical protein